MRATLIGVDGRNEPLAQNKNSFVFGDVFSSLLVQEYRDPSVVLKSSIDVILIATFMAVFI